METVKQIVYRDSDGVLMIIADNEELTPTPRFYSELTTEQKTVLDNLKTFALTKVADIKYIVHTAESNTWDLEPNEGDVVRLEVSDLGDDKPIVDAVSLLCTQLLNS
jgi:hypothetical protein